MAKIDKKVKVKEYTPAENLKSDGDFWITPSGKRIDFQDLDHSAARKILFGVASGRTGCHPDKWKRLAALAEIVGVGAPLVTGTDRELGALLQAAADDAIACSLMALRPLHDAMEEKDLHEDFRYALRWMIHLKKIPLQCVFYDAEDADDVVVESDAQQEWVWSSNHDRTVMDDNDDDEEWGGDEPVTDDDEYEMDEDVDFRGRGLKPKRPKKNAVATAEDTLLISRLVSSELPATITSHMSTDYFNDASGARRVTDTWRRSVRKFAPGLQESHRVMKFHSFNEAVAALAAALCRLRIQVPNI